MLAGSPDFPVQDLVLRATPLQARFLWVPCGTEADVPNLTLGSTWRNHGLAIQQKKKVEGRTDF